VITLIRVAKLKQKIKVEKKREIKIASKSTKIKLKKPNKKSNRLEKLKASIMPGFIV